MNWRWISLAALLAALVIGYGALVERSPAPTTSDAQPEQPGYYLQDAIVTQTQQDGSRQPAAGSESHRAAAPRRQHRDGDRARELLSGEVWQVAAARMVAQRTARASCPPNFRVVQLFGDVVLRPADAQPQAFLRTDALAIDTQTNVAYSTCIAGARALRPHAMVVKNFRADLNSENIRLESVNGRFEPQ